MEDLFLIGLVPAAIPNARASKVDDRICAVYDLLGHKSACWIPCHCVHALPGLCSSGALSGELNDVMSALAKRSGQCRSNHAACPCDDNCVWRGSVSHTSTVMCSGH